MLQRVYLTKTFLEAAKRTPATGRIEYRDAEVRGLLLRVSEFGYKSFSLCARFPGQRLKPPLHRRVWHCQPGRSSGDGLPVEGDDPARD